MTRSTAAVVESPITAAFEAADRNGMLSEKEYESITTNIAYLLKGIHSANVRTVMSPEPTPYPGYQVTQKGYKEEQVELAHNRSNSIKDVSDNMIPLRFYWETEASFIAGLVDEFNHIGDVELMFIVSDHGIIDPSGKTEQVYTNLSPHNINSLMIACLQLETKAKQRTHAFFEQESRSVEIKVSVYGVTKSINPSTRVMIVFDFLIL